MPTETERSRETRDMRRTSRDLGDRGPLDRYIARRRLPGPDWMTWQEIAFSLHEPTGEVYTSEGVRSWAVRYGIPAETKPTDSPELVAHYRTKLAEAGIEI